MGLQGSGTCLELAGQVDYHVFQATLDSVMLVPGTQSLTLCAHKSLLLSGPQFPHPCSTDGPLLPADLTRL